MCIIVVTILRIVNLQLIFEKIIDNVKQKTKLNIFRFNKNLQTKSSLKLNDYKEFSCRFRLKLLKCKNILNS